MTTTTGPSTTPVWPPPDYTAIEAFRAVCADKQDEAREHLATLDGPALSLIAYHAEVLFRLARDVSLPSGESP